MSSWEIIRELCAICELQNNVIRAQSEALAQVGAAVVEEEKAEIAERYTSLLGDCGVAGKG